MTTAQNTKQWKNANQSSTLATAGRHHTTWKKQLTYPRRRRGQARIATLTEYFETTLIGVKLSVPARTYAESRGLDAEDLQRGYFGVGLVRKWNKDLQESAEKYGLMRKTAKDYRPKVNSVLMFGVKSKAGWVVDVYVR